MNNGPDGLRSHDLRFRRPPRCPNYATGPFNLFILKGLYSLSLFKLDTWPQLNRLLSDMEKVEGNLFLK